ncbi:MAG: GtrA family protein [Alphaproteobacteria bacterium]
MRQLSLYTLISGLGFVLDCTLFALLHLGLHTSALPANLASAAAAVTLVYFLSAHRVFNYQGQLLWPKFGAYVAYQTTVILLFSWIIATLALWLSTPALAIKLAVVPVQFLMNYLILKQLMALFEKP